MVLPRSRRLRYCVPVSASLQDRDRHTDQATILNKPVDICEVKIPENRSNSNFIVSPLSRLEHGVASPDEDQEGRYRVSSYAPR